MDRMIPAPEEAPAVSVVVPCRGQARELRACLEGLSTQATPAPFEIVLVDSAADQTVAETAASLPGVRLVRSPSGLLPGSARNLGVRHARGRWIAFIDADCIPEGGWLAAAVAALEAGARMVTGPVLDTLPLHPIASTDNALQFADFLPRRRNGPVTHCPGCNLAVVRAVLDELGGFPEALPIGEDTALSSAAAARWPDEVVFVRDMRVRHRGRVQLGAFREHQERFGLYRARLASHLRPHDLRLGRSAPGAALISGRRLAYIALRTLRWRPATGPRMIVFLPVFLVGLAAWARGFRAGCREMAGGTA
ncbi:MAG: glycosyltransferase family 2 protein [Gemmatimonadota bacterium]